MYLLIVVALVVVLETQNVSSNICDLPKKTGPCCARYKRYYFNVNKGRCIRFFYGGCDGNKNNFKTKDDCLKACQQRICTLPLKPETCYKNKQWYYDANPKKCERLEKGSCNSNKNRFRYKIKCEQRCKGVKINPCGPLLQCMISRDQCRSSDSMAYEYINGVRCYSRCSFPFCENRTKCCEKSEQCETNHFCSDGCCVDSRKDQKPGTCPVSGLSSRKRSECSKDSQCPDKQKCCQSGYRNYCVDPDPYMSIGKQWDGF